MTSLSVNREFGIESLGSGSSMELLQSAVELRSLPAVSVSVRVVHHECSLDLLSPSDPLLNAINGVTQVFLFTNASRGRVVLKV